MNDAERQEVAREEPTAPDPDVEPDAPQADPTAEAAISAPDRDAAIASDTPGPQDSGDTAAEVLDLAAAADADPRSKAELLAELMEAEARRDEYLDDVRRARAEFENFRKRVMREGVTQRDLGKATVLEALLEVLDDVDRTLAAAEASDDQPLARGVELMAGKLVQALQGVGLHRIAATGIPFDPGQHEAVQQHEAQEPTGEPTVTQVLRPGYRLGDRVLRAAMVVVEQ